MNGNKISIKKKQQQQRLSCHSPSDGKVRKNFH